jgi:hypothetical protein
MCVVCRLRRRDLFLLYRTCYLAATPSRLPTALVVFYLPEAELSCVVCIRVNATSDSPVVGVRCRRLTAIAAFILYHQGTDLYFVLSACIHQS